MALASPPETSLPPTNRNPAGAVPPAARLRRWVLIGYWTFIYLLTHWPGLGTLAPSVKWFPHTDKVAHFSMYAGWMFVWWWVLSAGGRRLERATFKVLLVGGAAYGLFDELTQLIVGRDFEMLDWAADLTGMTVVALLLTWWQRRRAAKALSAA